MPSFKEQLDYGKCGESKIAQYMKGRHGFSVLPVYEVLEGNYKGPRLFCKDENLVAPDMLCMKPGKTFWIEAKHKSVFTWHRNTGCWTTGIDKHHHRDYMNVAESTGHRVWLMFLHESDEPDARDLPYCAGRKCPTGLFICDVFEDIHHEHHGWGKHGMVYWDLSQLRKVADVPLEVIAS